MTTIPIVFAFDNNWILPAAVCIYSLFANANENTEYDVYFLYPQKSPLDTSYLERIFEVFPRHKAKYIGIGDDFDKAFQIRGINTLTYYRLLISDLLPEYDKVIYSDVDVIFQDDLSEIYLNTELSGKYLGVVNSLAQFDKDRQNYYKYRLQLDTTKIFYAGNIIINAKEIREARLKDKFMSMIETKYKFQDMDILNITCQGKVTFLPPEFCVTTYFCDIAINNPEKLSSIWTKTEVDKAFSNGIIHYNGQKPWKGWCPNFDIWWEYYRKSPVFDHNYYFEFFNSRLNELDQLPLLKRIKILMRYFVYGIRKNP